MWFSRDKVSLGLSLAEQGCQEVTNLQLKGEPQMRKEEPERSADLGELIPRKSGRASASLLLIMVKAEVGELAPSGQV